MSRLKKHTAGLAILFICLSAQAASAAGAFFPQAGETEPEIARVNAILIHDSGRTTLVYQPFYKGDREPFAWAIPVPALPATDCAGSLPGDPFGDLAVRTDPTLGVVIFENVQEIDVGGGCAAIDEEERRTGGYAFVYSRNVTNFMMTSQYALTRITNVSDNTLEVWLQTNGYESAGADTIGPYYRGKGWDFVIAEVTPQAGAEPAVSEAMMPLVLEFDSADFTIPLFSVAQSAVEEVTLTLYAFTDRRMHITNYAVIDFAGPATVQNTYEDIITAQSRGRFVLEYVDYSPVEQFEDIALALLISRPYMLTRFTGTFLPEGMFDDVVLAFHPTNDTVHPVSYVISSPGLTGAPPSGGHGAWPLLPLVLVPLLILIRRFIRARTFSLSPSTV